MAEKRLFIAEKPSLAATIAQALDSSARKENGYWSCGPDRVTWCYGHMYEPLSPEGYGEQYRFWKRETLPIIPEAWKREPKQDALAQITVIKDCLTQAECVINAGDPDREGQLLVDEVLEECGYQGKTLRIWLTALNDSAVKHALEHLEDNSNYRNLHDAALARQRADWLVGMNATRAMTVKSREAGHTGVLSQGRVQTPTLALVVNRDKTRADHKSQVYYMLRGTFAHGDTQFLATFAPDENMAGLDDKGRIADQSVAQSIVDSASGASGLVASCEKELKLKQPPLPHCLSSLQVMANSRHGMSAQEVLDAAQALYEKKLTTYPRTDCQYMASAELADAERIVGMLRQVPGLEDVAGGCDLALRSAAWDDGKLGAHTALAPTGELPAGLSEKESQVYSLIATAYCLQFYPAYQYQAQKLTLDCQGTWVARGQLIIEAGWTTRQADDDEEKTEDGGQALPELAKSAPVTCAGVELQSKKTTPPPKYTEGALIKDMASVHRFITDPAAKAKLRETEGIGTEATRAGIIETLKKRGFLLQDGKALVSTELGRRLIELTPPELKDPVTTAQWESRMALIVEGKVSVDEFLAAQAGALPALLEGLLDENSPFPPAYPCPKCGRPLRQKKKKDSDERFWSCAGYPECSYSVPDDNGKPGKKVPLAVSAHKCPKCGKGLIRRESKKKKGSFYWTCSGYPDCTGLCFDKGGRPDFNTYKTK